MAVATLLTVAPMLAVATLGSVADGGGTVEVRREIRLTCIRCATESRLGGGSAQILAIWTAAARMG